MSPLYEYLYENDESFKRMFFIKKFQLDKERADRDGLTEEVAGKLNTLNIVWKRPKMKKEFVEQLELIIQKLNERAEITEFDELAHIRAGMLCFAYSEIQDEIFSELAQAVTRYQISHDKPLVIGDDYVDFNRESRGRPKIPNSELVDMLMTYFSNNNISKTAKVFKKDNKTIKEHFVTALGVDGYEDVRHIFKNRSGDKWELMKRAFSIWEKAQ